MTAQPQSSIDRFANEHVRGAEDRCPLCNQTLPHDVSADDLQTRLQEREREAAGAAEKRLRAQFETDQAVREKLIRAEVTAIAEKALQADIAKATDERTKAVQERNSALETINKLKVEQDESTKRAIRDALQEQREVLEKDKANAVNQIQAQEFAKTQKVQLQLDALKRQLDQKTANELGEGAEIDLYEALRDNFAADRISRIKRGQPGADILHEVIHNGQLCGSIIYDSKNHGAWRGNFVEKLKTDQLAAKADHAVLATSSFPSGASQLCTQEDVIVCNPARVVELVRILRDHVIQSYRLRLSAHEREKKTDALYKFINSDRCQQLMNRYESIAEDLLDIDVKEVKVHEATWKTRGQLIRDAQKVHGDFRAEIDRIVDGTTE